MDNKFINLFIDNLVRVFRSYNKERFTITISDLKKDIDKDDEVLSFLLKKLEENKIFIILCNSEERINQIEVKVLNTTTNIPYSFNYQIQNLPSILELSSRTDIPMLGIIIMKITAHIITKSKILYKAIVLDLDDTIWKGTLSEIGIEGIRSNLLSREGEMFISFMKFIKNLASELGIFIAICSRNDSKLVESAIEKLDVSTFPLKGQIDYIVANNNDKSENIKYIAEKLSILPKSIIFVDDNIIIRDEVRNKMPEVFVPEWVDHNDLLTQLIIGGFFERIELSYNSQNRKKVYSILNVERALNTLPKLYVKIRVDEGHQEAFSLYSKSNQFKLSQKNEINDNNSQSLYFELYRKEDNRDLGICSVITYTISDNIFFVHNWAISCRYFGIGLEEYMLLYISELANGCKIRLIYEKTEYNQKVFDLLDKYFLNFVNTDQDNIIELVIDRDTKQKIENNTNLKRI